jgi:hypothetical protein
MHASWDHPYLSWCDGQLANSWQIKQLSALLGGFKGYSSRFNPVEPVATDTSEWQESQPYNLKAVPDPVAHNLTHKLQIPSLMASNL